MGCLKGFGLHSLSQAVEAACFSSSATKPVYISKLAQHVRCVKTPEGLQALLCSISFRSDAEPSANAADAKQSPTNNSHLGGHHSSKRPYLAQASGVDSSKYAELRSVSAYGLIVMSLRNAYQHVTTRRYAASACTMQVTAL